MSKLEMEFMECVIVFLPRISKALEQIAKNIKEK